MHRVSGLHPIREHLPTVWQGLDNLINAEMSDHEDIDPSLDAEVPEVATDIRPARNLINFFKGQPPKDGTPVAGPSEPPKKRAYVREKNAAVNDNKQTRLGAGLKPVKAPPVEVQVERDTDMITEIGEPGPSSSSEKKKPGRKPRQRAVNDEDEEFRAMSKAAKKKPGPKPKAAATKGKKKKDAESVSDVGSGSELPRGECYKSDPLLRPMTDHACV